MRPIKQSPVLPSMMLLVVYTSLLTTGAFCQDDTTTTTMAPPKYKLTYFNVRSRGEIPRLVFAAAKVDYDFIPVTYEQWPTIKPETPYGGLPVLEVDGVKHGQGMAISVFIATQHGLMGSSALDQLNIEEMLQLREEMIPVEAKQFLEQDAEHKEELTKNLKEEFYPRYLGYFDQALKRNNGGSGFVVGSKLSLGDLVLYGAVTTPLMNFPEIVEKFPVLLAHRKRIAQLDGIKEHIASLPPIPI